MQLYHYHPETGEYLSSSAARIDPVASARDETEVYLIPAHAVTDAPPSTTDIQIPVRVNDAWVIWPNWRGYMYWLPDGTKHTIEVIGEEPPADALDAPPPLTDAEIVAGAELQIDDICDAAYTRLVSREARYQRKYAEAIRYRDAGYPHPVATAVYPYIMREYVNRTETKRELADLIIAAAEAFDELGSTAEAARAGLPVAVAAATTETEKQAAADAIVAGVLTIAQQLES